MSATSPFRTQQLQQSDRPINAFQYTAHQDQTTLVLGVISYLDRLEKEMSEMREFVNLGFRRIESIGQPEYGGVAAAIEEYVSSCVNVVRGTR